MFAHTERERDTMNARARVHTEFAYQLPVARFRNAALSSTPLNGKSWEPRKQRCSNVCGSPLSDRHSVGTTMYELTSGPLTFACTTSSSSGDTQTSMGTYPVVKAATSRQPSAAFAAFRQPSATSAAHRAVATAAIRRKGRRHPTFPSFRPQKRKNALAPLRISARK